MNSHSSVNPSVAAGVTAAHESYCREAFEVAGRLAQGLRELFATPRNALASRRGAARTARAGSEP